MKNQNELTSFNVEEIEERLEFCSCPSTATEIGRGTTDTFDWVQCEYSWQDIDALTGHRQFLETCPL